MESTIQVDNSDKGETEANNQEQSKKSKTSNISSKSKGEEKEIYFIIIYPRKQKEEKNDLIFSKECVISPSMICNKEIKTTNNRFI